MSDLRISGASSNSRSESDIRVNYQDPSKIVAASNDLTASTQPQFFSSDGGATWGQTNLSLVSGDTFHSDPAVDWTSDGTAWSITIGIGPGLTPLMLRSYRSTDGGATWTFEATPSGAQTNVDREIMWVDHSASSPFKDQIYVTWHAGVPVFVSRRTTGAGAAWQTPVQVSGAETAGTGIGGDIKTNSAGDVFVFWPEDGGNQQIHVAKSTNGGVSFGAPVTVATVFASQRQISIPADTTPHRMARVYVSGGCFKNASKDLVYAVWTDLSGEAGCTTGLGPGSSVSSSCKSRIWFARSTDGGATWSAPTMINNQSGKNDQFHSRLCVDETDGKLVVIYYDTVGDSGRLKTDIWMQHSDDDGVTWSDAVRVTSAQTDESVSGAASFGYGDYLGLSGIAGTFFPSWTDRRSGGAEEIWTAPIVLVPKAVAFVVERSTLGQDEVDARRGLGSAVVSGVFRVVVDGFTAAELGVSGSGSLLSVVSPVAGLSFVCTGNTSETGGYGPEVQRFTFDFDADFGATDAAFGFAGATELFTVDVSVGGIVASADLELIKQPDPFILHGDPTWLSVDLRVFVVRAGETRFGVTMGSDASAAPGFVQQVIANLNAGGGSAGGESFAGLSTGEAASSLFVQPEDGSGTRVFNFALAKVHYIGLIGAADVRVFFRLFQAQSMATVFDFPPGGRYRRAASNPDGQPIALPGTHAGEYATIPCFARPRVDSTAVAMDQQTDPDNVQSFVAVGGAEVDRFYGCWLDINQPFKPDGVTPNNVLPATVPGSSVDGPFTDPGNPPLPLQQAILRFPHQCLVAEIAFDPVAIPVGKDPGNWDKLAQRNLAWSDLGSAEALCNFEIKPTRASLPVGAPPDELMIDWRGTPSGGSAQVYLPALEADAVLALADRMYATHSLSRADAHTVQCATRGITYIPIPPGGEVDHTGLLSVDLPDPLRRGERFDVVVRQITSASGKRVKPPTPTPVPQIDTAHTAALAVLGTSAGRGEIHWRRVLGAFQLSIPVKDKQLLLEPEERLLSVMRWIGQAIPAQSRWSLVYRRYLERLAGRVRSFGGDPTQIEPSPTGHGKPHRRPHHKPGPHPAHELTGKIAGLSYDHFGDFAGFILETDHQHHHHFASREPDLAELAQHAWRERLRITVHTDPHQPNHPLTITIHQPPTAFSG